MAAEDCDDLFPRPRRHEPRPADPPAHGDTPRPLLTLATARRIARDRLNEWRRDHGH
jgi:hypothetical protein